MRCALPLHPESFVKPDRIDHQCVGFPVTDRVSVKTRSDLFGMRPSIHVNDSERLRPVFIEDVNGFCFGDIDKLCAARSDELARPARRLATGMRLEQVRFAILIQSSCPGLERNLALLRFAGERRTRESASALPVFDRGVCLRFGEDRAAIRVP